MSTYKVIQDIEAEDKLLGPFTLRQFIYLIIVAVTFFIGFKLVTIQWFLVIPLLPHTIFFALLAAPIGREQSSEIWLLAKIRFALKPRKRIWDQSGIKELVTITAPKKIEKALTKGLSQTEVNSRLEALANTIDSRGWAIKNVNVNLFAQPSYAAASGSDRLVDVGSMPQQVPTFDVTASDDMMDEQNNPTAQYLDQMIHASSKAHRQQLVDQMKQAGQTPAPLPAPGPAPQSSPVGNGRVLPPQQSAPPPAPQQQPATQPDYWFLNANAGAPAPLPGMSTFQNSKIVAPDPTATPPPALQPQKPQPTGPLSEQELLEKIHAEQQKKPKNYGHLRVIKPVAEQEAEAAAAAKNPPPPPVTAKPDPAILELANNDDLNVATIARQANKKKKGPPNDEVVISLH